MNARERHQKAVAEAQDRYLAAIERMQDAAPGYFREAMIEAIDEWIERHAVQRKSNAERATGGGNAQRRKCASCQCGHPCS